jgi:hypothetical protein
MSRPPTPKPSRRLLGAGALLLGVMLTAVWLEDRAPGALPLLAVVGCLVFHWLGHGQPAGPAAGHESDRRRGMHG